MSQLYDDLQLSNASNSGSVLDRLQNSYRGRTVFDREGYPVVIGGGYATLNQPNNAVTLFGHIHLNSEELFEDFQKTTWWRTHEHWHIKQVFYYFHGDEAAFAKEIASEYAYIARIYGNLSLVHNYTPLEIDAINRSGQPLWQWIDPWAYMGSQPRPSWAKKNRDMTP